MSMNRGKLMLAVVVAALLTGCATRPRHPMALAANTLGKDAGKVGVMLVALPKPDLYLPGAECLLCLGVATAANSSLNTHSQSLPVDEVLSLKHDAAEVLRKKGLTVVEVAEDTKPGDLPSFSGSGANSVDRDYTLIKNKYQLDRLVVLDIQALGIERPYASYIATGEPKAVVRGRGYLVDLSTNTYQWYQPINVVKASDGKWDEPTKFPGLSNAYFQAIEGARDALLKPLER